MRTRLRVWCLAATASAWAVPAGAQEVGPPKGGPYVEVLAGHAGFADEGAIGHAVFGVAARVYLTPRISVGPEITYMRGPGEDRDWFFLGNLTWDIRHPRAGRPPRVSPFLIIGGGFFTHSDRVGTRTFSSSEGAFAGGGGTRVHVTDRVHVMVDFRIGWELHYRVTGGFGVSM